MRDAVVKSAEAGKHIFCEKPISLTLQDADEMIEACRNRGVLLQLGFVLRYASERLNLKEILQRGDIGCPVVYRMIFAVSAGAMAQWVHKRDKGGGPLIEGAMHHFDWTRSVFGEAKEVVASIRDVRPEKSNAGDTITVIVRFQSGDELVISMSYALPGYGSSKMIGQNKYDIIGPKGVILFHLEENKMEIIKYNGEKMGRKYLPWHGWGADNKTYNTEMVQFIQCIRKGKEPLVTGEDGRKALEIALSALKSARCVKMIKVR